MIKSKYSPEEMERRRKEGIEIIRAKDAKAFSEWYQKKCDTIYMTNGPCCAGCDHWTSDKNLSGQCQAGGILSGRDVMASITGGGFSSYTPPPDYPYRAAYHHCSLFKDDFDWSTLDAEYLKDIGFKG